LRKGFENTNQADESRESITGFMPLSQAALTTPYSAEYLGLLARRNKLFAKKIDGVWHTTRLAIKKYIDGQSEVRDQLNKNLVHVSTLASAMDKSHRTFDNYSIHLQGLKVREHVKDNFEASLLKVSSAIVIFAFFLSLSAVAPREIISSLGVVGKFNVAEKIATDSLKEVARIIEGGWSLAGEKFVAAQGTTLKGVTEMGSDDNILVASVYGLSLGAQDLWGELKLEVDSKEGIVANAVSSFFAEASNFLNSGFKNFRNLVWGKDTSNKEFTKGNIFSNNSLEATRQTSSSILAVSTQVAPSSSVEELRSELRAELEAYLRTQLSLISPAAPSPISVIGGPDLTTAALHEEVLVSYTRSAVVRQSEADSYSRARSVDALVNSGTFTDPVINNARIVGGTFSGSAANFTSLTVGSCTGCGGGSSASSTLLSDNNTFLGESIFANATSTNFFSTTASSTNLFSSTATIGNLTVGSCTGCGVGGGSASSTLLTDNNNFSGLNIFSGAALGIGTTSPWARLSVGAHNQSLTTPLFVIASSSDAMATTTHFVVTGGGKVGIGTTDPGVYALSVVGGVTASAGIDGGSHVTLNNTAAGFRLRGGLSSITSPANGTFYFSDSTLSGNGILVGSSMGLGTTTPWAKLSVGAHNQSLATPLFAVASSSTGVATTTHFVVTGGGKVGIGTSTPWRTFSVNGTAAFTGLTNDGTGYYACVNTTTGDLATSTTACGASSIKYKENVTDLDYGLMEIMQLRPVGFDWKEGFMPNGTHQIGFIAEEVELIIPEIIGYNDDGEVMNLDYAKLTSVIVNALQEVVSISGVFKTNLIAWFSDTTNGITDFFANRVRTQELCMKDESGETCITKVQLDQLLANAGITYVTPSAPIISPPELENESGENATSTLGNIESTEPVSDSSDEVVVEPVLVEEEGGSNVPGNIESTEPVSDSSDEVVVEPVLVEEEGGSNSSLDTSTVSELETELPSGN
jgi:hypothetical protein